MENGNKVLALLALVVVIAAAGFYLCRDNDNGGVYNNTNNSADNGSNNAGDGNGNGNDQQPAGVNSFEECVSAGYPAAESYPRQCKTPEGKTFVEDVGNELDKTDLIRISSPRPNDSVKSPLKITGEARGFWFNEASFPIKIYDASGKELGTAIASAKSDWMTEEFVPFEAILTFSVPASGKGSLVLQKDNPSGLPENDDSLRVPVIFGDTDR